MVWWWSHDERGEQHLNAQEVLDDLDDFTKTRIDTDNPRLGLIESLENFALLFGMADVADLNPAGVKPLQVQVLCGAPNSQSGKPIVRPGGWTRGLLRPRLRADFNPDDAEVIEAADCKPALRGCEFLRWVQVFPASHR